MIEGLTQLSFSMAENPGVYAVLLGSGVSRAAEIPTGWEIVLDLTRRLARAEGVEGDRDWAEWHRDRFGSEPGYSKLLDDLSLTAAERRSILHNYIEPAERDLEEGRKVPTPAHRAIALLVRDGLIKVIITTNFDRLMESALREVGVEPTVIKSVDDLKGASPLVHSRCFILKIHGDYLDNRILNTDDELETYPEEYGQLLDRIMDEYGLIVAGWSADWDPALRSAIARAPNRRFPTYWAVRGEPTKLAADLISARGARLIQISDADAFFGELQRSVDLLVKARRPDPRSVHLVLAAAKRFLARPEHRIELVDLFAEESELVAQRLLSPDLPVSDSPSTEDAVGRWKIIEGIAEPLARIFGLAGRWGNGSEFGLARDTLHSLLRLRARGGNTFLIGLQTYPAYLCFLTFALGLMKAERFSELFRWFTQDLPRPDRANDIAASTLFMSYWKEMEPDHWKMIPGYERRKTPWADYLADTVAPWSRDYGLSSSQALENYNAVELLGGVASLTSMAADTLLGLKDFTWMPYGRLMWNGSDREATLRRLESAELHPKLLAAGFSNGEVKHWDGVKHNIGFLERRVGW